MPELGVSRRGNFTAVANLADQVPLGMAGRDAVLARARAHRDDCGCAMGAAFVAGALLVAVAYLAAIGGLGPGAIAAAAAAVLAAAALGKATGVTVAVVRLALLRRSLARRVRREVGGHVHVH